MCDETMSIAFARLAAAFAAFAATFALALLALGIALPMSFLSAFLAKYAPCLVTMVSSSTLPSLLLALLSSSVSPPMARFIRQTPIPLRVVAQGAESCPCSWRWWMRARLYDLRARDHSPFSTWQFAVLVWKRAILAEAGGRGGDCDSGTVSLVARDDICRTNAPARDARLGRLSHLHLAFLNYLQSRQAIASGRAPNKTALGPNSVIIVFLQVWSSKLGWYSPKERVSRRVLEI